jgi:hypothetical protein
VAAEIEAATGLAPELIEGKSGIFDVTVDATRIFCKQEVGRFPNPGEVSALIQS